jgi:hypothetical protein
VVHSASLHPPRIGRPALTRASVIAAGISVAFLAAFLLYLAGGPVHSDDVWFHLVMGEHFFTEGLYSGWDPILYTAHDADPLQHEWLFGVLVHGLDALGGFTALRVANVLAAAAAMGLAWSILRREAPTKTSALLAMALFLSLAWWRLHLIHPDLVTIPLVFLLYRLLLATDQPLPWWRVLCSAPLLLVWANAHPGFVIGLLLLAAGLLGMVLRAFGLGRLAGDTAAAGFEWARVRRLGVALALGLVASIVNPRGVHQHLTFLRFRESATLAARDEWPGFRPWHLADFGGQTGGFEFAVTDALIAAFAIAALMGLRRFLRRPSRETLLGVEPVALGLASASFLALLIAMRFNWLCIFPLVFLLRSYRSFLDERPGLGGPALAPVGCVITLALFVGFFTTARYGQFATVDPRVWRSAPYTASKYYVPGVQFLGEAGVEGHVFSTYNLGGFLGYWLRPRVLAFIDGRNEAYPPEVYRDYERVVLQTGAEPGESLLELLDRRDVDLFFGNGYPFGRAAGGPRYHTTAHLDGAPGWMLVFRSVDHAIYLRQNERNRANLERIAAYYARQGVPFDTETGLDVESVIKERPDWAIAHQMLPLDYTALLERSRASEIPRRLAALDRLGLSYALLGAWQSGLDADVELLELKRGHRAASARQAHALLRLGRTQEALRAVRELRSLLPSHPAAKPLGRVAVSVQRRGRSWHAPAQAMLNDLPLLDVAEARRAIAGRFAKAGRVDPARFEGARGS